MNARKREQETGIRGQGPEVEGMGLYIQVITTTEKRQDADKIAGILVDRKLAGCAQILGPVTSIYRWKGQVETAEEWQCIIKSRHDLYGDIEKVIKSVHPYEVPEIIVVPLIAGSKDYLEWLDGTLIQKG
jgi:periplasmic divalent cation tolerance protein